MHVQHFRYGHYGDMFKTLLKDNEDETWDVYFVFEKESPADEVLATYEVSLHPTGWRRPVLTAEFLQRCPLQSIHFSHCSCSLELDNPTLQTMI